MRNALRSLAFVAALLPGLAAAQTNLPANTVWGRLGIPGTGGPPQAIPFSVLSGQLTSAIITLNSGNGQTAPGAMSGGNTYSIGATTDTVQMKGLGLGGTAPLTGLEVYNAAVTPTGTGQGMVGASSTNGGGLIGQGSVYDSYLGNNAGNVAIGITTGTQNTVLLGTLTAASLTTSGTIGGSLCATSAGLVLYKSGVNCFAVSGITVVSGKTLTIDNTLELAGTDGTKFTFPATSDTVATLGVNQTFTGNNTFSTGTVNFTGTTQLNGTAFGTFATQNFATPPAIGGTTPAAGSFSTLSATTPLGLSSGGTNASTAAGARASGALNVDGYTPKGDTNYTILATDRTVGTSTSLTAARTWTLPAASAVNPGQEILIVDMVGGVTNTNTLTISRAGSDTINGGTTVAISVSNGAYLLKADGVSKWTAQQLGAQATVGVSSINGQTGNPSVVAGNGMSVSTSGGNISVAYSGSVTCNGLAITASGICPEAFGFANCTLAASVSGNALTVALKDNNGADPSATSPCRISFRSSTLTTGTPVLDTVSAALSVTVPSGQAVGSSNNVPFRFWVEAVDNAGTPALAVYNASASGTIFPIQEANLISTTAIATAPSAGVFYSTSVLSTKAFTILGYVEYSSGLSTAGTYASGPTTIQTYRAGIKKPGETVQIGPVGILTTQGSNTAATYTSTGLSTTITPTSKVNYISCQASGVGGPATASDLGFFQIQRGGNNVGLGHQMFAAAADLFIDLNLSGIDAPGSTGTLTYTLMDAVNNAGHSIIFPAQSGVMTNIGASIGCSELQG